MDYLLKNMFGHSVLDLKYKVRIKKHLLLIALTQEFTLIVNLLETYLFIHAPMTSLITVLLFYVIR